MFKGKNQLKASTRERGESEVNATGAMKIVAK